MSKNQNSIRTAESVSPGHPDKLCDQISDAIVDAYLAKDPRARVAIDVAGGHGAVFVTGEVSSRAEVDIAKIVRRITGKNTEVIERVAEQSPEIARGVDAGGAGDQGIMVGYACNETPELLPLEAALARRLNQCLYQRWPYDGKTQVSVRGRKIVAIVASFQHAPHDELEQAVKDWVRNEAVRYVGVKYFAETQTEHQMNNAVTQNIDPILHINPAGDWQIGGFDADAGLTGRKLAVDNYGPRVPLGGGAFSGKDPSKVDRSAAYMARKIAIDYLRRSRAGEVLVRLAYAIGCDQPVEATAIVDGVPREITGYDLTPNGIIETLDLRRPIYEQTARYGHFGHADFPWEPY